MLGLSAGSSRPRSSPFACRVRRHGAPRESAHPYKDGSSPCMASLLFEIGGSAILWRGFTKPEEDFSRLEGGNRKCQSNGPGGNVRSFPGVKKIGSCTKGCLSGLTTAQSQEPLAPCTPRFFLAEHGCPRSVQLSALQTHREKRT